MTRVLITGMSATGKSTVLGELARRGHRVQDMDDPGWSIELDADDGDGTEQLWRIDRLTTLLDDDDERTLFVAGCARNQIAVRDHFSAVILLSVPHEVILRRLDSRPTNSFGRTPDQRRRVLADLEQVEPRLRATATAEIDTTGSLADVADQIEDIARRSSG